MTTHALSDNWLTDDLSWENTPVFDVPFMPGVRVRVLEGTAVQWDDNPRRLFKIWIGEQTHVAVMWVKYPSHEVLFCSDHDAECDCKKIAREYMRQTPV